MHWKMFSVRTIVAESYITVRLSNCDSVTVSSGVSWLLVLSNWKCENEHNIYLSVTVCQHRNINLSRWRGPRIILCTNIALTWRVCNFQIWKLSNTDDGKAESEWVPDNYQRRCLLVIIKVTISRRHCLGSSRDDDEAESLLYCLYWSAPPTNRTR